MSFTPAIPSLSAPMGASPKPTLVLDLEGVAGKEVKLHEWLDESNGSYYDFTIDWGDGTVERVDEDNFETISHTYAENAGGGVSSQPDGSVKARVAGKFGKVASRAAGLKSYLKHVCVENTSPLTSHNNSYAFANHAELDEIPVGIFENCTASSSFAYCFSGCPKLSGEIPVDLFARGQSNASVSACFSGCSGLKRISNGLFDNVQKTTSAFGVFDGCRELEYCPVDLLDKNSLISVYVQCFYNCNKLPGISLNLWSATSFDEYPFPRYSKTLRDAYFVNINPASTAYTLNSLITILPNITSTGKTGTLHLRKNIPEAVTSFTAEDEATANALGWTIVDEGTMTS